MRIWGGRLILPQDPHYQIVDSLAGFVIQRINQFVQHFTEIHYVRLLPNTGLLWLARGSRGKAVHAGQGSEIRTCVLIFFIIGNLCLKSNRKNQKE